MRGHLEFSKYTTGEKAKSYARAVGEIHYSAGQKKCRCGTTAVYSHGSFVPHNNAQGQPCLIGSKIECFCGAMVSQWPPKPHPMPGKRGYCSYFTH